MALQLIILFFLVRFLVGLVFGGSVNCLSLTFGSLLGKAITLTRFVWFLAFGPFGISFIAVIFCAGSLANARSLLEPNVLEVT